ncbi:MAG: YbhQ family protein, partial [Pantoea agglomerans]
ATTTYYFGAAMMTLFLVSRIYHNNLLLACLGVVMLLGPALVSLLVKEPPRRIENKRS